MYEKRKKTMSFKYEQQLEDIIARQKEEITRLLKRNAELQGLNSTICDVCKNDEFLKETAEQARAAGQEEAWKLALKLRYMDYEDKVECFDLEYDVKEKWIEIMEKYTYTEAAAKVTEWERKKKEICVGDIVEFTNGIKAVVIKVYEDGEVALLFSDGGYGTYRPHKNWHKTDRHIDVDAWMAQIGGGSDE